MWLAIPRISFLFYSSSIDGATFKSTYSMLGAAKDLHFVPVFYGHFHATLLDPR